MGFDVNYSYVRTTVVVRSAVSGPDSNQELMCQHTKVPMPQINIIPHPVTLN